MDLTKLQSQLESAKTELDQLKSGRKVSASRARAALMKVKKESDILRKEILTYSKSLPVKQRTKIAESPDRKTKVAVSPSGSVSELPPVIPEPSGSVSKLPPAVVIPEKPTKIVSKPEPVLVRDSASVVLVKPIKATKPRAKKDVILSAR